MGLRSRLVLLLFLFAITSAPISQAQTITSITPTSGVAGTQITITGTSLACPSGWNCTLSMGNNVVVWGNIVSWTDTQIVAIVPLGLPGSTTTMPVMTTYMGRWEGEDAQSNTVYFTLLQAPITSISPTSGWPGTQVTITGSSFGESQGNSAVIFNGITAQVVSWNDTQIVVTVPSGAKTGNILLTIPGLSPTTGPYFQVFPYIASIDPPSGGVGTEIEIHGEGLDPANGPIHVLYVNGNPLAESYWSDTLIRAQIRPGSVPPNATTVPISINYDWDDGWEYHYYGSSNTFNYPVSQASISSIVPSAATPTQMVTINGAHFGATQQQSTVTFTGIPAEITSWSDTQIQAVVPEGARTGYALVNVPGLGSGWFWFSVRPWLKEVTPSIAVPNTLLTIRGQGLTLYNTWTLYINGQQVPTETWTESVITFRVPPQPLGTSSISIMASMAECNDWDGCPFGDWTNTLTVPFQLAPVLTLTAITPDSGYPGTVVTITGTGFGATQGTTTVSFNGISATPTFWSDSEIQVPVPSEATSGPITVTVGGASIQSAVFSVLSTPTNPPTVTGMSPTSGPVGTEIVISGTYFGSTPAPDSAVLLGSIFLPVISWSDMSIRVTVPETAVSGMVSISTGGYVVNAGQFTVTGGEQGADVVLSPNEASMVIGETRTLDALDASGVQVSGLPWSSSDTNVVTLSSDDPPILTAVGVGTATITADTSTATIHVYAGALLPEGTVKWAVPGDGTDLLEMKPAVPSPEGIADVFAVYESGKVQAITAGGHVAWTTNLLLPWQPVVPDFQGGLIVTDEDVNGALTIEKIDGKTGQKKPGYALSVQYSSPVVHTDGTVITIDGETSDGIISSYAMVGINSETGVPKFRIPITNGFWNVTELCDPQYTSGPTLPSLSQAPIIAGDGYIYLLYSYKNEDFTECYYSGSYQWGPPPSKSSHQQTYYRLLRIATDGTYTNIPLHDETTDYHWRAAYSPYPTLVLEEGSTENVSYQMRMLTNSDRGVVVTQTEKTSPAYDYVKTTIGGELTITGTLPGTPTYTLKAMNVLSGAVAGESTVGVMVNESTSYTPPFMPVLQQEDGTFIGVLGNWWNPTSTLLAFDVGGQVKWSKTVTGQASPEFALTGGDITYRELSSSQLVTLDATGNELSRKPYDEINYTWKGAYKPGSTKSIVTELPPLALSFGAAAGGNLTGNGFALVHHTFGLIFCGSGYPYDGPCRYPDMQFSYYPDIDDSNFQNAIDVSTDHPDWTDRVKNAALKAFKKAFANLPVIYNDKVPIDMIYGGTTDGRFEHRSYVVGTWVGPHVYPRLEQGYPPNGWTPSGSTDYSLVYYLPIMGNAQIALGTQPESGPFQHFRPSYPPTNPEETAKFGRLMQAIGTAIGNVAAHETGHQLKVPRMDCETTCQNDDRYVYEFHASDGYHPWFYQDDMFGPVLLHWSPDAACWLENIFVKGSCNPH